MTRAANLAIFASNPPTVNSTAIAVGANVYMNATSHFVGNSTVNTTITQTTAAFNTNATTTALYVAANSNLGIGNTTPVDRFSVNGTTYLGNTTTAVGLITGTITTANNANYLGGVAAASYLTASSTSATPQFSTLGLGGTGSSQLVLSGYNAYGGTGYHTFMSVTSTYGSVTNGTKYFRINTTGGIEIINSAYTTVIYGLTNSGDGFFGGGLGVGTAASGTAGEIRATNNITAYYTSDRRFKENIVAITNAVEKVKTISGVNFDWTQQFIDDHGGEDDYFLRRHDVGVIAQEIQTVVPEAVATREDGSLAVRYEKIIPLLIQSIKELTERLEVLESK